MCLSLGFRFELIITKRNFQDLNIKSHENSHFTRNCLQNNLEITTYKCSTICLKIKN